MADTFHGFAYCSMGMSPQTRGSDIIIPCVSGNSERLDLTPF